jgi:hypothetical protein
VLKKDVGPKFGVVKRRREKRYYSFETTNDQVCPTRFGG